MPLSDPQSILILVVFAGVILAIAFDWIDMVLAALLGVCTLTVFGILDHDDVMAAVGSSQEPLALLFGGMVVARTLEPTGIFENVGTRFLILTRGSGRRFLLGIVALVAPICAFLPNATTVILVAPIIIRTAIALEVDFVGPMILTAIISNSAGLLTLVGDPATFLVGSSIGLTFMQYLQQVSLGGLLSVLIIIVLLPRVLGDVWRIRRELPAGLTPGPIQRPGMCALSLSVLVVMLVLFVFGDMLPVKLVPPAAAIIAATLALLVIYALKVEPIGAVLKDVDWKTLIFIACMFFLVQALTKTDLIESMTRYASIFFGNNLMGVGFFAAGGHRAALEPAGQHPRRGRNDPDVPDGRFEDRDNRQDEEERRKTEHDVDKPHDDRIRHSTVVSCQSTQDRPDEDGNPGCDKSYLQRDPRPPDHPGQDIPPEWIRPEEVPRGGRRKDILQIDGVRIAGGKPGRKQ